MKICFEQFQMLLLSLNIWPISSGRKPVMLRTASLKFLVSVMGHLCESVASCLCQTKDLVDQNLCDLYDAVCFAVKKVLH